MYHRSADPNKDPQSDGKTTDNPRPKRITSDFKEINRPLGLRKKNNKTKKRKKKKKYEVHQQQNQVLRLRMYCVLCI